MRMKYNENVFKFVEYCNSKVGAIVSRDLVLKIGKELGVTTTWLTNDPQFREARGIYRIPTVEWLNRANEDAKKEEKVQAATAEIIEIHPERNNEVDSLSDGLNVPNKFPGYVKFGFYNDVKSVVQSNLFYPVFITGHTGNGKTLMVEQICAELKRECIRVNISIETDESDLIGGPTLVDGNIVVRDGPVVTAMRKGAILLIDEIDRGSNKLMCIQGIMEGKPYYNKKSGEIIHPQPGFNIIATANSKGRGSENGKYLSQILDDAFLERFPLTIEQEYPSVAVEKKILKSIIDDEQYIEMLVTWASGIRKTFEEGGVDEIISTRRLVHIATAYKIYGDRLKSIRYCVNRFDEETRDSFIDLYTKIDESMKQPKNVATEKNVNVIPKVGEEIPF